MNDHKHPVILGVRYFLAHTPGLVRHGSKPFRDLLARPSLWPSLSSHLRSYRDAVAYPPHQAFLGAIYPDQLANLPKPWYKTAGLDYRLDSRWNPHGEIMPEEEFYALLKVADDFNLVWLEEDFSKEATVAWADHPLIDDSDTKKLDAGVPLSAIEAQTNDPAVALPLRLRNGRLIGCVSRAHQQDATLTPDVLLENLACKASAAMAFRTLLSSCGPDSTRIEYVINSGEEAVGERYQRGGGNLGKAVAEMSGCVNATGADVKAFCSGPVHALIMAGALVSAGVYKNVAVVAGCSLAKLGMKYEGHMSLDQPVLEDVLAGMAVLVGEDDGVSPRIRLDSVGRHNVGAGPSQQAIFKCLVSQPLERLGLRYQDIDKYATELHNPELTEPSGSGNVPLLNYRLIAGMATLEEQLDKSDISKFVERHGMPGFSPTQGHIASAVAFLGHALDKIVSGEMQRAMFLAKGSLFLGRMTQLSDGLSFILERNQG